MKKKEKAVILIVDDKPANIFALEALLAANDRILLSASSGKEALVLTLNKSIDLIILDVQMPDMDGFEVAQILKSNRKTSDIPIIFATAESKEHRFVMKGYGEGGIDYLFKPLDPEIVKAKVAVLLKVQLQKKELLEKNAALQKSALLINNSADIIGIIDMPTFMIEEINQAFGAILGYTPEEARDTPLLFFLPYEDRVLVQNLIHQDQQHLFFETRIYCSDRCLKWLQWKVVAKHGKWYVNARDITEVKQVEKIRNYLSTVVKQSNDAIYIHDHEGKIISWNEGAEKIYGYSEGEALNMKTWNIIPEYLRLETEEMLLKILAGDKIQEWETKRITKQGRLIDVQFSANVIQEYGSEQLTIAIMEREVTLQRLAEAEILALNANLQVNVEQLEAINQELESFSYTVSHDLRSPLRAMNFYSQIIEEEHAHAFDDEGRSLLSKIRGSAQKMETLIGDLLAFSKLGKKELDHKPFDMRLLVEDIIAELSAIQPHNATIQIKQLHSTAADPSLIGQVWHNLLANAIKYSHKHPHPQIEIGSEITEQSIAYYIKDNGAGFNMDFADKLFTVFHRLHPTDEFEGVGIGLATVQRIIAKHRGKVWAEGKVDEGAVFWFTLPME